jgi:hypothetical protein
MELTFQTTVLIIAIVILIFALVLIGYTLNRSYKQQKWPPVIGTCPDYWDVSGNMCVQNTKGINVGLTGTTSFDYTIDDYKGERGICNLYTWSKNNQVIWDGVNSGNGEKPAKC